MMLFSANNIGVTSVGLTVRGDPLKWRMSSDSALSNQQDYTGWVWGGWRGGTWSLSLSLLHLWCLGQPDAPLIPRNVPELAILGRGKEEVGQ